MSGRGKGGKGLGKGGAKRHRKVLRDNIQGQLALMFLYYSLLCGAGLSGFVLIQLHTGCFWVVTPLLPACKSVPGLILDLYSASLSTTFHWSHQC